MRRTVSVLIVIALLLAAPLAFAQPIRGWRGSGGWGMGSAYQRMYNPATVQTVTGTVEAVELIPPARGMSYGVHLQLRTGQGVIPVSLGPSWYIERLDMPIDKGDEIEVTGSRATLNGQPAIIAAEVRKGEDVLTLRDENGVPVWAGWRGSTLPASGRARPTSTGSGSNRRAPTGITVIPPFRSRPAPMRP